MSAKNVKTLRAAHESWNKRDFAGVVSNTAKGLAYTDHGRNITLNNREKFREWTEGWAKAFSDGRIINPQYIDAGDIVVAQFTAEGTNDGPFGSMKLIGRKMSLPFCEICHFGTARARSSTPPSRSGRLIATTSSKRSRKPTGLLEVVAVLLPG